jgi:lipopolysaccharide transport system permease protein
MDYFSAPLRYRQIFVQFLRREILGRYRASVLGVLWAFLTPLLMLGVYTFVFMGIFQSRWPGVEHAGGAAFALRLFAGLMVFNLFAEVTGRASMLVVEQPNLVKKVAFPLELLPFISLGTALFHFAISCLILVTGSLVFGEQLSMSIFLLPFVILPLLPLLLGLSWLLAALGVFIRDIAALVGLGISLLMFLSPVFYSVHSLAPRWQSWMYLNPLTPAIEHIRALVFFGQLPPLSEWLTSMLIGLLVAVVGSSLFKRLRGGFAVVL